MNARRDWLLLAVTLMVTTARLARAENPSALAAPAEITVFAAASLTNAFTDIAHLFETQHPGTKVTLNFGGSQQLAAQILESAPADVFASANAEQMKRVVEGSLVSGKVRVFSTNRLAIAVAPGNPKRITGLADLSRSDLLVVLAAGEVPAGRYAREALKKAGATVSARSLETDVRSVLSKVALGEADAGIVYNSDIVAAGTSVSAVEIPAEQNVVASYPIAVLAHGSHGDAATELVHAVLSGPGRSILARFGFGAP